jgi:hypothetical protein
MNYLAFCQGKAKKEGGEGSNKVTMHHEHMHKPYEEHQAKER